MSRAMLFVAAELRCPAVTMVMDTRLPLSQRWTFWGQSGECVYTLSRGGRLNFNTEL